MKMLPMFDCLEEQEEDIELEEGMSIVLCSKKKKEFNIYFGIV